MNIVFKLTTRFQVEICRWMVSARFELSVKFVLYLYMNRSLFDHVQILAETG